MKIVRSSLDAINTKNIFLEFKDNNVSAEVIGEKKLKP